MTNAEQTAHEYHNKAAARALDAEYFAREARLYRAEGMHASADRDEQIARVSEQSASMLANVAERWADVFPGVQA